MRPPRRAIVLLALPLVAGCAGVGERAAAPAPAPLALEARGALLDRDALAPPMLPAPAPPRVEARGPTAAAEEEAPAPLPAAGGLVGEPPGGEPAPAGAIAFVAADRVNLRPCPEESLRCGPRASLRLHEEVRVAQQAGGWALVRVPRLGQSGYVARRFVAAERPLPERLAPARGGPSPPEAPAAGRKARGRTPARGLPAPEEELLD